MRESLLVVGPDSSVKSAFALAREIFPDRKIVCHEAPTTDYYRFDLSGLSAFPAEKWEIAIAVNEYWINDVRRAFHEAIAARGGYREISLISPRASVSPDAEIGKGSLVYGGCFLGGGCQVGRHAVLRPNVFLGENVRIGNYVTLEANVSIREDCCVGDFVTVCANSSLLLRTSVGAHCYLNLARQYSGKIRSGTFYSPMFENPIHFFGEGFTPEPESVT
ncbi:MAG: hypothetical protein LBG69_01810 [Zoogloeaceae bacterium]|jgi:acetyltransferase-like isoleucine patch superfamily enzyme|nr:hypothetical protein [Zoogloeaceae bacterium]